MPEDTDTPPPETPEPGPPPGSAPPPSAQPPPSSGVAEPSPPAAPPASGSLDRDLAAIQRGRPERAFNVGAVVGAVVAVAAAVFVVQNAQPTAFDWLWFDFELPLWTALLGAMAVGVLLVVLAFLVHDRRQRRIDRRQQAAGRLRRALRGDARAPGPSSPPPATAAERGRTAR